MLKLKQWVLYSSTDPDKVSLTLKGLAGLIIPVIMFLLGLDTNTATEVFSDVVTVISMVVAIYGFTRKLSLTVLDKNATLNKMK